MLIHFFVDTIYYYIIKYFIIKIIKKKNHRKYAVLQIKQKERNQSVH